jgi:23S rRNA maturation mini-RNase III
MVDSERVRYMYMYYIFYRLYLIADGGQRKSEIHVHVSHFLSSVSHVHVSHSFTVHHQLWDTDDKKFNTCTCISLFHCPPVISYEIQTSERVRYMYMYYIFYRLYLIADGGQRKSEIHVHVSHFLSSVSHSWWWTVKEWVPDSCLTQSKQYVSYISWWKQVT